MKTNFIKKFMLMTTAFAVAFGMNATTVFAAAAINTASNDLKTLRVSNYSAVPGSMTWSSSVNASADQIVSVGIYYHSSGDAPVQNLKIQLTPQTTGVANSHTFSTTISSHNAGSVTDTATVNIVGGAQSLSYIPTAVYWYPNQACLNNPNCQPTALPFGQNGSELFGQGLVFGNIAPGWATQGGLTVQFKVSSNGDSNTAPSVSTYEATGLSDTSGSATLKGFVNPNGTNTTVWFKYRRSGGSWMQTSQQSVGTTAQNFSKNLTGLADGNYEYRAVANTTYEGVSKYFTIGDDSECDPCDPCGDDYPCEGGDDEPSVDTLTPSSVDEDSATLRGKLTDDGNDDNDVYFKWGTSSSNLNRTLDAGTKSSTGSFSENLSGLDADETYYYKACADNSSGSDCGSIESFTTDSEDGDNDGDNDRPDVTTLNAYSIGATTAVVDGYFTANGCSTTTSFEYGRTNNLGSTTSSVNRGNGSGSMAYGFSSLAPSTTYYYRAVATNCEGTTRGAIKSFTTRPGGTVEPVTPVVIGTGGGSQFIKLMIDNNRGTVRSGTDIVYDLSWQNVTRSTIKGLILEVNFDDMVAIDTDMGNISRDGHSVIVELNDLGALESGEMSITTKTSGNLKEGDPVVAQAIMAFENPKTSASENAIAYDSDEFTTRGSNLGASIFGLGLPTSLGGWLLILLIILLIIVLARHFMRQNRNQVVVNQGPGAPHPVDVAASPATGNDYIVYRPTPKV
jgi:hypothetical protein